MHVGSNLVTRILTFPQNKYCKNLYFFEVATNCMQSSDDLHQVAIAAGVKLIFQTFLKIGRKRLFVLIWQFVTNVFQIKDCTIEKKRSINQKISKTLIVVWRTIQICYEEIVWFSAL